MILLKNKLSKRTRKLKTISKVLIIASILAFSTLQASGAWGIILPPPPDPDPDPPEPYVTIKDYYVQSHGIKGEAAAQINVKLSNTGDASATVYIVLRISSASYHDWDGWIRRTYQVTIWSGRTQTFTLSLPTGFVSAHDTYAFGKATTHKYAMNAGQYSVDSVKIKYWNDVDGRYIYRTQSKTGVNFRIDGSNEVFALALVDPDYLDWVQMIKGSGYTANNYLSEVYRGTSMVRCTPATSGPHDCETDIKTFETMFNIEMNFDVKIWDPEYSENPDGYRSDGIRFAGDYLNLHRKGGYATDWDTSNYPHPTSDKNHGYDVLMVLPFHDPFGQPDKLGRALENNFFAMGFPASSGIDNPYEEAKGIILHETFHMYGSHHPPSGFLDDTCDENYDDLPCVDDPGFLSRFLSSDAGNSYCEIWPQGVCVHDTSYNRVNAMRNKFGGYLMDYRMAGDLTHSKIGEGSTTSEYLRSKERGYGHKITVSGPEYSYHMISKFYTDAVATSDGNIEVNGWFMKGGNPYIYYFDYMSVYVLDSSNSIVKTQAILLDEDPRDTFIFKTIQIDGLTSGEEYSIGIGRYDYNLNTGSASEFYYAWMGLTITAQLRSSTYSY